ncbi:TetR family transcriptional regulator [Corynebacterium testudinoris]|uniref:Transcriptional regulator, TetR family n=1 Tax=Corynebacterium testudinoris TaxID=136857 RepID=A0A0G3HCN5_9CORY|nr:TetR family transcriptional regulator [Corynebacterium testudinoris]AKK09683.1 transcriptional regulator, TetR family [Corynebacterium testudinoris]MBX8996312.1 TetR family transcriptional regulator [Corynebacterium testudinoris]
MRTSKRDVIIQGAIGIIEARGVDAVSYESLADASGLSKSGIIYHFPSRLELLRGIIQHFIDTWEAELEEIAGAPASELSDTQRLRAVVQSMGGNAERAELLMCIESRAHDGLPDLWESMESQWMTVAPESELYPFLLMAYGLWAHDHVHHNTLTLEQRTHLVDSILRQIPE